MRLQGHRAQLRLSPRLKIELSEPYSSGVQEMRLKFCARLRIEIKIRCHRRTRLPGASLSTRFIQPDCGRGGHVRNQCALSQPQPGEGQRSSLDGFTTFLETATYKWRPSRWGARDIMLLQGIGGRCQLCECVITPHKCGLDFLAALPI